MYTGLYIYRAVAYIAGLAHYVLTVFIFPLALMLYNVWVYFHEVELLLRRLISSVTYYVVGLGYSMATEAVSLVWWLVSCVVPPVLASSVRITFAFIIAPLVQVSADAVQILFDLIEVGISKISRASYSLYTSNFRPEFQSIDMLMRVLTLIVKVTLILFAVHLLLRVSFSYREVLHLCYRVLCDAFLCVRITVATMRQYFQQYAVGHLRWQQRAGSGQPNSNNDDAYNVGEANDMLCIICVERTKCVVLQPCNHLCLCQECERRLPCRICPICRRQVVRTMRVFVA